MRDPLFNDASCDMRNLEMTMVVSVRICSTVLTHQQIHTRLLVLLALRALLTDFGNPILFQRASECTSVVSLSTYRSYFKSGAQVGRKVAKERYKLIN